MTRLELASSRETTISGATNAAAEAKKYGLKPIGVRPPLGQYIKDVVARREFLVALSSARAQSENQNTYLGQFWTVLTPLLNSLVYVLIFGFLLDTTRGLENIIGFIVVGTFMYGQFTSAVTDAARSIKSNLKLVRALNFPRVLLPFAAILKDFMVNLPGVIVMVVIAEISVALKQGTDALSPERWILIVPALLLMILFSTGLGMILARIASRTPDVLKLLPFILRIGMYASGVIFAFQQRMDPGNLRTIMEHQPVAVYLNLARQALISEPSIPVDSTLWIHGVAWALVIFVIGFVVFWRDEARYGRD